MSRRNHSQSFRDHGQSGLKGGLQKPGKALGAMRLRSKTQGVPLSKRTRSARRDERLPFIPPENWHEPTGEARGYRIIVQPPGEGYRHVLTPDDVRQRLAQLPKSFLQSLEVVQFSRMTRKKQSFPCYGMQWGSTLYLYPIEQSLVEKYDTAPRPSQLTEARMYGGVWQSTGESWTLTWTEESIRDFYLNNILIHELGHIVDDRNRRPADRERYAEWFAVEYGYRASRGRLAWDPRQVRRRHQSV